MLPAVLLLVLAVAAEPGRPEFTYRLKKGEDGIGAAVEKGRLTLRITSPSGIGAAEATLTAGSWPRHVALQLNLAGLEHLAVSNGRVTLQAALGPQQPGRSYFDRDGNRVEEPAKAVYTVLIERKGPRLIEVTLPADFCGKETKKLEIDWIDFFRS
jgi:hypothetical protein